MLFKLGYKAGKASNASSQISTFVTQVTTNNSDPSSTLFRKSNKTTIIMKALEYNLPDPRQSAVAVHLHCCKIRFAGTRVSPTAVGVAS